MCIGNLWTFGDYVERDIHLMEIGEKEEDKVRDAISHNKISLGDLQTRYWCMSRQQNLGEDWQSNLPKVGIVQCFIDL